jgi:hypothetical protein
MARTESENHVNSINQRFFFKEFTFSSNEFVDPESKQKLEVADHIIWLDYILFIVQIKQRNSNDPDSAEKWFKNKVLNKAVKQVKSTHSYLDRFSNITIRNNKGHSRNLADAKKAYRVNLIIYSPGEDFPEELRQQKFYPSSQVGLIHLLHQEDYDWVCRYLITPAEVDEYLYFRERLFVKHGNITTQLPEQYVLGHFLETFEVDKLESRYIRNLEKVDTSSSDFDMSFLIENFNQTLVNKDDQTDYYPIIQEIALLNRFYLKEFKKRFNRSCDMVMQKKDVDPYRIHCEKSNCSFVFIPLADYMLEHWKIALENLTYANKYDMKAHRAIGVAMFCSTPEKIDMYWFYLECEHAYDENMERMLKENNPFREVKRNVILNRYDT